jgi:predicted ATPase/DNA-binding CsgD family transcriptional regulator
MQDKIIIFPEPPPDDHLQLVMPSLPVSLTQLVGREQEVQALHVLLLRPDVRLLTLTGTPGVGKTRLALEVARHLVQDFADGVYLVSLAPLSDPAMVIPTIAHSIGLTESSSQPILELLKTSQRDKQRLLVLDNFEQVVTAAQPLTDLLTFCSDLKLLVTSRAPLHVQGEHEFPISPLAVPDLKHLPESKPLSHSAAVVLFLQRAQAIKPSFQITTANARALAEICIRLDGLPLAIELAAARIKLLSPQALLTRLEHRLHLLTSGAQDAPTRQQTLRNAIGWSYNLLNAQEQNLFRRLSVFVGGCTLEAIEAVCVALDKSNGAGRVLDGVASLIDKSLLQQMEQEDGEPRFAMLETIREYALEALVTRRELEAAQQAHATYYLALAEQAEGELEGPRQIRWLQRLEYEHDNLRAALKWGLSKGVGEEESSRRELALRLGGALGQFWIRHSHLLEGWSFLEQALAAPPTAASASRAKVLGVAADLALVQFDRQQAEELAEEGLALCLQLEDQTGIAYCLRVLGLCATWRSEYDQAQVHLQESAALYRALGNKSRLGWSLVLQGITEHAQGQHTRARVHYEEALELFRELGDMDGMASMHFMLGLLLFYCQGDALSSRLLLEKASRFFREEGNTAGVAVSLVRSAEIALLGQRNLSTAYVQAEEALGLFRELSYKGGMAEALFVLARVQARQRNYLDARSRYEEILTLVREGDDNQNVRIPFRVHSRDLPALPSKVGDQRNIPFYLEGLAEVVAVQGEGVWAARLWGAAETLREELHAPLLAVFRADYGCSVAAVRTQLSEQAFAAAWAEGRDMTAEQVLAAQGQGPLPTPISAEASSPPAAKAPSSPDGLTLREMEVLRLLAQSLTSAQIAERLVISVVTVNFHVRSIYSKLGVSSRSAATRYAIEHHLV